jgi:hypothetical protein
VGVSTQPIRRNNMFIFDIFKEKNGDPSSMRVMAFITVCTGCAVAVLGVLRRLDLVGLTTLSAGLVSAGMGFKALQKGKEPTQ